MTRHRTFRRSAPLLWALAAGLALSGCLAAEASSKDAPRAAAPIVTCVRAGTSEMVETILVTGTLVPRDEVTVSPENPGLQIVAVEVEEGEHVAAGQVLARLARAEIDARVEESAAALALADAAIAQARSQIAVGEAVVSQSGPALERIETLIRSGAATQVLLEQRVAEHHGNVARLSALRQGLALAEADKRMKLAQRQALLVRRDQTEIRAPVDGLVVSRTARLGAITPPVAPPLFRIAARGDIELEAEVPAFLMPKLRVGQSVRLNLGERAEIEGRVRLVLPEIDRASRLGRIRVTLPADRRLQLGAFARGRVETARRMAVAVPNSALLHAAGSTVVQTVVSERVVAVRVETGLQIRGRTEIRSGLEPDHIVVARAGAFLQEGDRVDPLMQPGASEGDAR